MIGRLHTTVIDCPDPHGLARFYAGILRGMITYEDDGWVTLSAGDGSTRASFQRAPDLRPPRWPDPAFPPGRPPVLPGLVTAG
jgi:hypothetical protein